MMIFINYQLKTITNNIKKYENILLAALLCTVALNVHRLFFS